MRVIAILATVTALACYLRRPRRRRGHPRRIYVMRHGEKTKNTPSRDNFALALVPEAYDQLKVLRRFLEAHEVAFGTVLASPFLRCRQTASALAPSHGLEPGLAETMNVQCGLRDGSGAPGPLETIVGKVAGVVDDTNYAAQPADLVGERVAHAALVAPSELERDEQPANAASMERAAKLTQRLQARYAADDAAFPMLLVAHGCSSHGVIRALADGGVPTWLNERDCAPMGSMTVLEEVQVPRPAGQSSGGSWRVVGSMCPKRAPDGVWECCWRAETARGADPTKL